MTARKDRIARHAVSRWVPIAQMKVNPNSQRALNQAWVDKLAADFDPEQLGHLVVNLRDKWYWIMDGMHRMTMMRQIGWGDQQIQCDVYEGLSEQEEADGFLKLNDQLAISALSKYKVALTAARPVEVEIDRIVRAEGLIVSKDKVEGAVTAVGTLRRVHGRAGSTTLARTLHMVSTAYGDAGLTASVIDGMSMLCHRYNGDLDDAVAIEKLSRVRGGVNGLLGKAEKLRAQTREPRAHCVAAAAVDIINTGQGGKKLRSWWRAEA